MLVYYAFMRCIPCLLSEADVDKSPKIHYWISLSLVLLRRNVDAVDNFSEFKSSVA